MDKKDILMTRKRIQTHTALLQLPAITLNHHPPLLFPHCPTTVSGCPLPFRP